MTKLTENQKKLMTQLSEMFQFDHADLDFGIYRIMNYKRDEIKHFLEKELMPQISDMLMGLSQSSNQAELEKIEKDIKSVQAMDVDEDTKASMIQKLEEKKASYTDIDITAVEADIYSHLTEFFSRYYDEGDFISQRRYKDGIYAIPYEGEEVKLHWANADQYYVKTSEYFKDYTFKTPYGKTVHFKIKEAETEKDNNKSNEKRFFQLYTESPFALENGELIIYFEYKAGAKKKQDDYNKEVISEFTKVATQYPDFADLLAQSDGKSLLERQLNRYTARNTFDYFIHKDLGKFLNRELDFYIKNEVMFLDDIDEENELKTKEYLLKAKIIRAIGKKIIAFLAQIENFQKMLWLKKKFVVETNYCITLDRVPKKLYPQIIENKAQVEEWVRLFAIDEIEANQPNLAEPPKASFSDPLTIEFLEQNPYLVLDTAFFSPEFKEELVDSIDNLDDNLDGLLIHSENFQALNLLQERFRNQINCIYADPPYNAKSSEILYKNNFKHSSWISFMHDRLLLASFLKTQDAALITAIDENELHNLLQLLNTCFPTWIKTCVSIIHNPAGIQGDNFSYSHEYAIFLFQNQKGIIGLTDRNEESEESFRDWGGTSARSLAKNCFYPIYVKNGEIIGFGDVCDDDFHPGSSNIINGEIVEVYPISDDGVERKWVFARDSVESILDQLVVYEKDGVISIRRVKTKTSYKTVWTDTKYYANIFGSKLLNSIMGSKKFDFPKSVYTVQDCLFAVNSFRANNAIALDYFAGSGTTGHAVINLNRADNGKRKYILVEMGEYFDTVTKPRIQKAIYSEDWRDGKPVSRKGSSHAFKYLRLESYEDTLNNIEIEEGTLKFLANPEVREQYMLHYFLPNETKSSLSLLNIDRLDHPFNYAMNITRRQESKLTTIDLVETFNYLIGLKVERNYALQSFDAEFITGEYGAVTAKLKHGSTYRFKMIEGTMLNGDRVLVIWRNLTGDKIKDNAVLDAFFQRKKISTTDFEYKKIYVNGDNNLPNLRTDEESWKVVLIEEEMKKRMFSIDNI
jgi:adenine-specific DNA-methyltransferase